MMVSRLIGATAAALVATSAFAQVPSKQLPAPQAPAKSYPAAQAPAAPAKSYPAAQAPAAPAKSYPAAQAPAAPTKSYPAAQAPAAPSKMYPAAQAPAAPAKSYPAAQAPAAPAKVCPEVVRPGPRIFVSYNPGGPGGGSLTVTGSNFPDSEQVVFGYTWGGGGNATIPFTTPVGGTSFTVAPQPGVTCSDFGATVNVTDQASGQWLATGTCPTPCAG